MQIIKLKSIYYISFGGYTLTEDKPYVEADEKALETLKAYIEKGYLEIKELEEQDNEKATTEYKIPDYELAKANDACETNVVRVYEFTEEELKKKTRKELIELCKERGLEFKKNISVADLETLILENQ